MHSFCDPTARSILHATSAPESLPAGGFRGWAAVRAVLGAGVSLPASTAAWPGPCPRRAANRQQRNCPARAPSPPPPLAPEHGTPPDPLRSPPSPRPPGRPPDDGVRLTTDE